MSGVQGWGWGVQSKFGWSGFGCGWSGLHGATVVAEVWGLAWLVVVFTPPSTPPSFFPPSLLFSPIRLHIAVVTSKKTGRKVMVRSHKAVLAKCFETLHPPVTWHFFDACTLLCNKLLKCVLSVHCGGGSLNNVSTWRPRQEQHASLC